MSDTPNTPNDLLRAKLFGVPRVEILRYQLKFMEERLNYIDLAEMNNDETIEVRVKEIRFVLNSAIMNTRLLEDIMSRMDEEIKG